MYTNAITQHLSVFPTNSYMGVGLMIVVSVVHLPSSFRYIHMCVLRKSMDLSNHWAVVNLLEGCVLFLHSLIFISTSLKQLHADVTKLDINCNPFCSMLSMWPKQLGSDLKSNTHAYCPTVCCNTAFKVTFPPSLRICKSENFPESTERNH